MTKGIHQYVSSVQRRDAIGEYAFVLRDIFRGLGYESEIFYDSCSKEVRAEVVSFDEYNRFSSPKNFLVIHYGIKLPYLRLLTSLPEKKILIYHNITPGNFFKTFAPWMINKCQESRQEVTDLRKWITVAAGDSDYNSNELREMGYENVHTIPLSVDFSKYKVDPDPKTLDIYSDDEWINWLFVGRISPNKKHEDLIKCFYYYQKYINRRSRLFLVGHGVGMNSYVQYLKGLIAHLGVTQVHLTGSVSQEVLAAFYKTADLFIAMSEHEGFCVPLLEAFYYGVPIFAYDSSAVAETLGGAGVLIKEKRPAEIATLADYLLKNPRMKADIIEQQTERLKVFKREPILKRWKELIISVQTKQLTC